MVDPELVFMWVFVDCRQGAYLLFLIYNIVDTERSIMINLIKRLTKQIEFTISIIIIIKDDYLDDDVERAIAKILFSYAFFVYILVNILMKIWK